MTKALFGTALASCGALLCTTLPIAACAGQQLGAIA